MTRKGISRHRKPLYLDATVVRSVHLDGPALRVLSSTDDPRHFPLRRLSRIVIRGPIDLSGKAVLAILEVGLPVTWLNEDQTLAGHVFSAHPPPHDSLTQRLDDIHALTDITVILENWRLSRLRKALLREVKPYLGKTPDLRAKTLRNAAARKIYQRIGLNWNKEVKIFRSLLRGVVACHLRDAGITARWMDPGPNLPDLSAVICNILETTLWRIGLELSQKPDFSSWKKRIAFFEHNFSHLDRHARAIVEDLARHLFDIPLHPGEIA